jgi:tetratricopeptide (TPR) repeat protein
MADPATIPGKQRSFWLILIVAVCLAPGDVAASWTVDMSAAAAHLGGPSTYTFATKAEADAFVAANSNYGARLVPGGSDSGAGGGGASPVAGLPGGTTPGLTAQQQLALSAAQAALPLLQNVVRNIFSGSTRVQPVTANQDQRQVDAQLLYNSGIWYMRQKDYADAIVEFQKALARTPGNQAILNAMAEAQRQLDLAAHPAAPNAGAPPVMVPPPAANTALNLIDLGSGSNVVDLRGTTKTSVDPAALKAGSPPDSGQPLPGPSEADAQFDKMYNQMELERMQERKQLDADFDKLYNQMELERKQSK